MMTNARPGTSIVPSVHHWFDMTVLKSWQRMPTLELARSQHIKHLQGEWSEMTNERDIRLERRTSADQLTTPLRASTRKTA